MKTSITLRAPEPEDLNLMYEIENDEDFWQYGGAHQPVSRYTLRQYIEQCCTDIYRDGQIRLTIIADGIPVGFVDLTDFYPRYGRAEVGIAIAKTYQRKGYGSLALKALLKYNGDFLHIRMLYAYVPFGNIASVHLFEAVGFKHVASLPSWLSNGEDVSLMYAPEIIG